MITKRPLFILFLVIFSGFVGAVDNYNYYFEDPVVPHSENLNVKNNLLVDSFTGAAVYIHPIDVPPGTNGLEPSINLLYNSHSTKGRPSILGAGWSISESYLQRNTNHTFGNISDDTFILVFGDASYDLVNSSNDGRYHSRVENFLFLNKTSGGQNEKGEYWILRTKDGTSYRFGFYNFSELVSNKYGYVSRWSLDLVNDTHNNSIFYNYSENPFPLDKGVAYLDSIKYNNDKTRSINFHYGQNNTIHLRTAYENGNLVAQSRMLKEIVINTSNQIVRKYIFAYKRMETEGTLSFVSNITEYGNDSISFLPPVTFDYDSIGSLYDPLNWTFTGCTSGNTTGCFVDSSGNDKGVRFTDINADGLVDIVRADNGQTLLWLNNGSGWNPSEWSHEGCGASSSGCFASSGLDIGTRLVDLNGDGLVDVFRAGFIGTWTYLNNGTGWKTNATSFSDCQSGNLFGCFVDSSNHDQGVRFIDLDNDGLVDLFKALNDGGNPRIRAWKNYGFINDIDMLNFTEMNWTFDGCKVGDITGCFVDASGGDKGVRLVDFNGDGLEDVVRADSGQTLFWMNNGTGWEVTNWSHEGCEGASNGGCFASGGQDVGTRLADLNGDGLIDVFRARGIGGSASTWTFINNGTGWDTSVWTFYDCQNGGSSSGCFVDLSGNDRGVRLLDYNGDGLADILKAEDNSGAQVGTWINNGFASLLLKHIDFSLGGELYIEYQKSTYLDNTGEDNKADLDFNSWLVLNITRNNNISGVQNLTSNTFYNFTGGVYDFASKEFRGFNMAEERISDKVTRHWFHQDQGRSGREYKTEILDNESNKYNTKEMVWNSTIQNGYLLVTLRQESESTYDGTSIPKTKNESYAYDVFGNIVYKHELGDVGNSNDDKFEYYKYVNNTNLWIVNKLANQTIFDSNNLTILKNIIYGYDNLAFGASPTKGSVTKKEESFNGTGNPVSLYSYNSFGNIINLTDPNRKTTKYFYGIRDTTNTFPDSLVNSKNQSTNYSYDLGTGNIISEKDSNGLTKNNTYDALSIEKTTILPFDTIALPTQEYSYSFTNVNDGKIIVKQREQNETSNTLDTYKFYDGFGKLIQTKTEAQNSKQIVVNYYYDKLGRIKEQSNPYLITATVNYSVPDTSVSKTSYSYDSIGRVIRVTNPDNSFKNFSYSRWNVTILDENNNRKDYLLDTYGRINRVTEFYGGEKYFTNYDYNGADNLIGITDSLNNTFNYTYDSLGRKIKEKDPDRGIWNYTYDSNSNPVKQFDNRNTSLFFVYDSLNRKLNESSGNDWVK